MKKVELILDENLISKIEAFRERMVILSKDYEEMELGMLIECFIHWYHYFENEKTD